MLGAPVPPLSATGERIREIGLPGVGERPVDRLDPALHLGQLLRALDRRQLVPGDHPRERAAPARKTLPRPLQLLDVLRGHDALQAGWRAGCYLPPRRSATCDATASRNGAPRPRLTRFRDMA